MKGMTLIPVLVCDTCEQVINHVDDALGMIQLTALHDADIIHKSCKEKYLKYKKYGTVVEYDTHQLFIDLLTNVGILTDDKEDR